MGETVGEQSFATGDQLAHARPLGVVRQRRPFLALDLGQQPLAQLAVQGPHQPADTVLLHLWPVRQFLAAQRGDGVADAVAPQDPVEALLRRQPLVECQVDERLQVLFLGRDVVGQGAGDRLGLAEHAEVEPGLADVALVEVQAADLPAGLADRLLVGGMRRRGEVGGRPRRNGGDAQFLPALHEQGVKKAAVILVLAQPGAQAVDSRGRPALAQGLLKFVEGGGKHGVALWGGSGAPPRAARGGFPHCPTFPGDVQRRRFVGHAARVPRPEGHASRSHDIKFCREMRHPVCRALGGHL